MSNISHWSGSRSTSWSRSQQSQGKTQCYRYGGTNHLANECHFKDILCGHVKKGTHCQSLSQPSPINQTTAAAICSRAQTNINSDMAVIKERMSDDWFRRHRVLERHPQFSQYVYSVRNSQQTISCNGTAQQRRSHIKSAKLQFLRGILGRMR